MLSIRPQISKVAKAREFTYVPRYFDERKEKIAEIERQIRKDEDDNKKGDKKVREFHFRAAMSNRWRGEDYDNSVKRLDTFKDKLKKFRSSGLEKDGEFSYENLVFKFLRRNGYIQKLFDFKNKLIDKNLSVENTDVE